MQRGQSDSKIVPEPVMDSVNRTLVGLDELRNNFLHFLTLCEPEVLEEMPPIDRAQSLLLLARATSTIVTLRLRCSGVHPDDHPINSEHERLRLYEDKLQRAIDFSKVPVRPSATLNYQAATRFIEHSLPDLTPEQKKSMRDISRGGAKIKYTERTVQKKRKYYVTEKQSVRASAQEFLEKAARELLGNSKDAFKGPLAPPQLGSSDEDDPPLG